MIRLFGRALDSNKSKTGASGHISRVGKSAYTLSKPLKYGVPGADSASIRKEIFNSPVIFWCKMDILIYAC
jgi:hypothetical protein